MGADSVKEEQFYGEAFTKPVCPRPTSCVHRRCCWAISAIAVRRVAIVLGGRRRGVSTVHFRRYGAYERGEGIDVQLFTARAYGMFLISRVREGWLMPLCE